MTTALLTLDRGSVLFSPDTQSPDEVVTKHVDGELVRLVAQQDSERWHVVRREESNINFHHDGLTSSLAQGIGGIADRQAFGFRMDGGPANPLDVGLANPDSIELESADRGAVLVEDSPQLPLVVYTTDETYYRLYTTDSDTGRPETLGMAALERRKGPGGDWERLKESEPTEVGVLVEFLAEDADMISIHDPMGGDIRAAIDDYEFDFYSASASAEEEERRRMAGMKDDTVFGPNFPKPRPVEIPE